MLEVSRSLRTPRPHTPRKGIGTLIGNGWLRESPRNHIPRAFWDLRSKSALRKCIVMPVPFDVLRQMPADAHPRERAREPRPVAPLVAAPPAPVAPPKRRDPQRDVLAMPAFDPEAVRRAAHAKALADAYADARRAAVAPPRPSSSSPRSSWDAPVTLGFLLLLAPPVGVAVLWSSRRYSVDARWALTIMTALVMCLVAAVTITALAMR